MHIRNTAHHFTMQGTERRVSDENATISILETVQQEGKRQVKRAGTMTYKDILGEMHDSLK